MKRTYESAKTVSKGVIYVCFHSKRILRECCHSVQTLRRHNPDLKVALFTNLVVYKHHYFDQIIQLESRLHPWKQKVYCLSKTPYAETLYLDADTEICGNIEVLFEYLRTHEFVIGNEANIIYDRSPPILISESKDEFNTGVLAYKNSPIIQDFFQRWSDLLLKVDDDQIWPGHFCDQYFFNELVRNDYSEFFSQKSAVFDNSIFNAVRWLYLNLSADQKNEVIIKHWHDLHLSKTRWKIKEYGLFLRNELQRLISGL